MAFDTPSLLSGPYKENRPNYPSVPPVGENLSRVTPKHLFGMSAFSPHGSFIGLFTFALYVYGIV